MIKVMTVEYCSKCGETSNIGDELSSSCGYHNEQWCNRCENGCSKC